MHKTSEISQEQKKFFTVIIPAYNAEKFIMRSINSVLQQSFQNFEVIVVNDGSNDNTLGILKSLNDNKVRIINQDNKGVSVARNVGIEASVGEFICFLDADDEFLPNHFNVLLDMIKKYPDKDFFATRFCMSKRDNPDSVEKINVTNTTAFYDDFVREMIKESEKICTGCVCIRRKMFEIYGTFVPGVKLGEDTDMWERIYVHTGVVFGDHITLKRNRDGSEATKIYTRRFEVDPLNRMEMFMKDKTIDPRIKKSLIVKNEYTKVQVVRSNLLVGNKRKAWVQLKNVQKKYIPLERYISTLICFIIPSKILMRIVTRKSSSLYERG